MYNKKHCDGERSVVVTFLTQAMFFFNGKRVKENRKVYRKQPPRPINEISVRDSREGVPSWKVPMCSRHRGLLENCMCVRGRIWSPGKS